MIKMYRRSSTMNGTAQTFTSGIQAGSLWHIAPNVNLFLSNGAGSVSPFSNPKFAQAFEKARVVSQWLSPSLGLSDQEDRAHFKTLSSRLFKPFSEEELNQICQTLKEFIKNCPPNKFIDQNNFDAFGTQEERALYLTIAFILSLMPLALNHEELDKKIVSDGKEGAFLFSFKELEAHTSEDMDSLLQAMGMILGEIGLNPVVQAGIAAFTRAQGETWDLGINRQTFGFPHIPEAAQKPIASRAELIWKEDLQQQVEKLLGQHERIEALFAERIVQGIEESVSSETNSLFILPDFIQEPLFIKLKEKKIELVGPIRQSIKPRGFLFQIEKASKVVGHFLGSIHYTSGQLVNNFNFKIKEAFDNCDVLGVENDITNEENLSHYFPEEGPTSPESLLHFARAKVEHLRSFFQEQGIDLPEGELTGIQWENAFKSYYRKNNVVDGADVHFTHKARERGIEIVELESLETHLAASKQMHNEGIIDSETLANLEKSFARELLSLEMLEAKVKVGELKGGQALREAMDTIRSEEAKKRIRIILDRIIAPINNEFYELYELGHLSPLLQAYNLQSSEAKESLYRRNLEMVLTTHKLIKQGKKVFAIAGAMHFAGEGSMIDHMEKMGYKITQIICEEPAE